MKQLLLISLFLPNILVGQNFQFNIYPLDDASEWRLKYKVLYNLREYRIGYGDYDDSILQAVTDTNLLIIKGNSLKTKDKCGKSEIIISSVKSKNILYKQIIEIKDNPKLIIELDKNKLINSNGISVTLKNSTGKICTNMFKCGYLEYELLDKNDSTLFSSITSYFNEKLNGIDISKVKKVRLRSLVISKENGLAYGLFPTEVLL
jgi:hypothetical protein